MYSVHTRDRICQRSDLVWRRRITSAYQIICSRVCPMFPPFKDDSRKFSPTGSLFATDKRISVFHGQTFYSFFRSTKYVRYSNCHSRVRSTFEIANSQMYAYSIYPFSAGKIFFSLVQHKLSHNYDAFVPSTNAHWYASTRFRRERDRRAGTHISRLGGWKTGVYILATLTTRLCPNCLAEYVPDTLLYCAVTGSRSPIRYLQAPSFKFLESILPYFPIIGCSTLPFSHLYRNVSLFQICWRFPPARHRYVETS